MDRISSSTPFSSSTARPSLVPPVPGRARPGSGATRVLAGLGALGAGVTAAVFTHFSTTVMPRLAVLPDADGIAAMQEFNRQAVQPPFMLCFFGAAVASVAVAVRTLAGRPTVTGSRPARVLAVLGAGSYLVSFAITVFVNVPRNDALAAVDPASAVGAQVWADYLREWTAGNHVRAGFSTVAFAALVAAALWPRRR